jgi:hypothetical protein
MVQKCTWRFLGNTAKVPGTLDKHSRTRNRIALVPGNNDRYETRSSNCLTRARPAQVTITDTGFVGQCCTGPSVKEYRAVIEHRRVTRIDNDLIELLSPDIAAMSALPRRADVVSPAGHVG